MRVFDVVVLGGGPAGEEAAARLADRGLDVVMVEDRLIGGECAHWACLPSKVLLWPYEARLRDAVPPFPTRSEIWLSLLEQAGV